MANYDPDYTPKEIKRLERHVAKVPEADKEALRSGTEKMDKGEELSEQEHDAFQNQLGLNTGEDKTAGNLINDRLNKGYTGKEGDKSFTSKLFHSNSRFKKKVAIAGAAAGGSALLGIIVFFAMLPLKIEHIMNNLDNHFAAASDSAIEKETENFYTAYVKRNVLPYLGKKGCHSTIDSTCVYGTAGSGAVGRLYKAWSQGKLENKMATKYGIVLQKAGSGSGYTLSLNGHNYDVHNGDIFNLSDAHHASTNEVRQAVRTSLKEASLYDKVYTRFKLGKLLEAKYGIKRCTIACNVRDNFNDKVSDKKAAAKAYLVERVIGPFSDEYSLIIQCIISPGACVDTTPDPTAQPPDENGNSERVSKFESGLQSRLDGYAAQYGSRKLSSLVDDSKEISKNGFSRYLLAKVLSKAGVDVTSESIDKVADPISLLKTATNIVNGVNKVGQLKVMGYAIKSAAAAGLYMQYRDVADEMKSGHTDATELGSFVDQLGTVATDDNGKSSDATATPLYNKIMGGDSSNTASILTGLFDGNAYADAPQSSYTCNDGKPISGGETVCPEEDLTMGNSTADSIQGALNNNPAWQLLSKVASTIGGVLNKPCPENPLNCFGDAIGWVLQNIPGFSNIVQMIGALVSPLFQFLTQQLLPSPFSANMSGGRTFDMLAAGSDVSENKGCQVSLGCAQVSNTAMADIQNQWVGQQKQAFDNQSMFARMFDTSSPYSLVSSLAMDMPTNLVSASNAGLASLITDPLGRIGSSFSSVFSGDHTFAATPAQADPFGVVQNAFTDIPSDPDTFWSNNCVNGPMGIYDESSDTLDVSKWLSNDPSTEVNGQPNTAIDGATGETYNLKSNPCLLIHTTMQSAGGAFDSSLLPQNSLNSNSGDSGTGISNQVTGDSVSLAKQVLANPNIVLDSGAGKYAKEDIEATANGQKVTPGPISGQSNGSASTSACAARTPVALDATLLQAMLNIASKYTYEIGDITSGHVCDSGRHPLGRAMDIFAVNGKKIDGHCTDSDIYGFLKFTTTTMSQLMPNGHWVDQRPVLMPGIGSCNPAEDGNPPSWVPSGVNYFFDSSDEIHVDTGVAS